MARKWRDLRRKLPLPEQSVGNPYDVEGATIQQRGEEWIAKTPDGHVVVAEPTRAAAEARLEMLRAILRGEISAPSSHPKATMLDDTELYSDSSDLEGVTIQPYEGVWVARTRGRHFVVVAPTRELAELKLEVHREFLDHVRSGAITWLPRPPLDGDCEDYEGATVQAHEGGWVVLTPDKHFVLFALTREAAEARLEKFRELCRGARRREIC